MIFLGKCVNLKKLHIASSESAAPFFMEAFERSPPHCGLESIFMALMTRRIFDCQSWASTVENFDRRLSALENALSQSISSSDEVEPLPSP